MKLTPKQLRQIVQEELSIVLIEQAESIQPPDVLLPWVSNLNNTQYQRLYNTKKNSWIDDPEQHGMRTKQGTTKAPIMVFTANVKDTPAGPRWRVWATGGDFPEDVSAGKVFGSMAGKIHKKAGRDSLMKENLPTEKLQQAVDDIKTTIKSELNED